MQRVEVETGRARVGEAEEEEKREEEEEERAVVE
jgi:hypothetical protein